MTFGSDGNRETPRIQSISWKSPRYAHPLKAGERRQTKGNLIPD